MLWQSSELINDPLIRLFTLFLTLSRCLLVYGVLCESFGAKKKRRKKEVSGCYILICGTVFVLFCLLAFFKTVDCVPTQFVLSSARDNVVLLVAVTLTSFFKTSSFLSELQLESLRAEFYVNVGYLLIG